MTAENIIWSLVGLGNGALVLDAFVYYCVVMMVGRRYNYWPMSGFYELYQLQKRLRDVSH